MTLSLNTNMAASKAAIHLANNTENLNKSLERLSSGKRINSASDDAGGLAVSMKMQANINNLKAESDNVENGITFLNARESILSSVNNILLRISELRSGTEDTLLSDTEKDATYGAEYVELATQLNDLAAETFSGLALFGTALPLYYDGGTANNSDALDITDNGTALSVIIDPTGSDAGTNGATATAAQLRTTTTTARIDAAIEYISGLLASNGAEVSRLSVVKEVKEGQVIGLQSALSRIMDVDIAAESANLAKQQILVQASASMVAQANSANNAILKLLQ